jgi:hypothetical protein
LYRFLNSQLYPAGAPGAAGDEDAELEAWVRDTRRMALQSALDPSELAQGSSGAQGAPEREAQGAREAAMVPGVLRYPTAYPYAFACPAGVMRDGDLNMGCTEIMSPYGDAVSGG